MEKKTVVMTNLQSDFRTDFLKQMLHENVLVVDFIKKDGTPRKIYCTLQASVLPTQADLEEQIQKKTPNADVIAVWDVEAKGWRSFRYDSIVGFSVGDNT